MPRKTPSHQTDVFLELLKETRVRHGVTQEEIAKHVGLRQTDVSKTERGVRGLEILELRMWLVVIGVDFVAFAIELDHRLRANETVHAHAAGTP